MSTEAQRVGTTLTSGETQGMSTEVKHTGTGDKTVSCRVVLTMSLYRTLRGTT